MNQINEMNPVLPDGIVVKLNCIYIFDLRFDFSKRSKILSSDVRLHEFGR